MKNFGPGANPHRPEGQKSRAFHELPSLQMVDANRQDDGRDPLPLEPPLYSKGRLVVEEPLKETVLAEDQLSGKNR